MITTKSNSINHGNSIINWITGDGLVDWNVLDTPTNYYHHYYQIPNGLNTFKWEGGRTLKIGIPGKKKEDISLEISGGDILVSSFTEPKGDSSEKIKNTLFYFRIPDNTKEIVASMSEGLLTVLFKEEAPPTINFK